MSFMSNLNTEDRVVAGTLILTMLGIMLGAFFAWPQAMGVTCVVVMALLLVALFITKSERFAWLAVFGLVGGVLELWSDWLHVELFKSLVYTDFFGFKLLASPSYMPLGWWLTIWQFGYLALRFSEKWGAWKAALVVALLGMSVPPWYEEFAAPAKAWHYTTKGLQMSNTPIWIILTYGGCMFGIAMMAMEFYRPRAYGRAIAAGFFTAASFTLSAAFFISLLG